MFNPDLVAEAIRMLLFGRVLRSLSISKITQLRAGASPHVPLDAVGIEWIDNTTSKLNERCIRGSTSLLDIFCLTCTALGHQLDDRQGSTRTTSDNIQPRDKPYRDHGLIVI